MLFPYPNLANKSNSNYYGKKKEHILLFLLEIFGQMIKNFKCYKNFMSILLFDKEENNIDNNAFFEIISDSFSKKITQKRL